MKYLLILAMFFLLLFPKNALAVYDPKSVPNNQYGIHILNPSEIDDASKLVNSSGGDWGYITIPIQAGDKDLVKWQTFMDKAKELHLIPIIRLATEGDYFNTTVWRKPDDSDILDFANFLNSLNWPTKNRYIVVFNEPNRADEWGGQSDPSDYAQILSYADTVFKSDNSDFFIISAGMDNAAATDGNGDYNEYTFFNLMNQAVPGIFDQIDGIASHSYPNPGFLMPSSFLTTKSIDTFYYEKKYLDALANKDFPVFITETGWDSDKINKNVIAGYYKDAFEHVWNDPSVIAVTPFIFNAGAEPFSKFSFLNTDGTPNEIYRNFSDMSKIKGLPQLASSGAVLSAKTTKNLPVKNYSNDRFKFIDKIAKVEDVIKTLFQF